MEIEYTEGHVARYFEESYNEYIATLHVAPTNELYWWMIMLSGDATFEKMPLLGSITGCYNHILGYTHAGSADPRSAV